MENLEPQFKKMIDLVNEIESYILSKEVFLTNLEKLDAEFQNRQIPFDEFEKRRKHLTKDKTKKDWMDEYNSYLYYLLKKLEYANSQIFLEAYKDTSYQQLTLLPKLDQPTTSKTDLTLKKPSSLTTQRDYGKPDNVLQAEIVKETEQSIQESIRAPESGQMLTAQELKDQETINQQTIIPTTKRIQLGTLLEPSLQQPKKLGFLGKMFAFLRLRTPGDLTLEQEQLPEQDLFEPGMGIEEEAVSTFKPKKITTRKRKDQSLYRQILEEEGQEKTTELKGIAKIGNLFGLNLFKDVMHKMSLAHAKKSKLVHQDLRMRYLRTGSLEDIGKTEHVNSTLLVKEAERIKKMMEQKRALKLYKPSLIGSMANVTVRKISFFLIDHFPEFFRDLYTNLRYSNIKILSNTYVNVMVFVTLASLFFASFIFPVFFFLQGASMLTLISKSFFMVLLTGITTFALFWLYPTLKIKERRRDMRTNLPFAINHMTAVAASGVPPDTVFRLISQTDEYGEICQEAQKIDQLVNIFGYDLLTAIKSVSSTTPSKFFKEFLEGIASTIESGGDLQHYLDSKSKEAMVDYELERQKYTEAIGAYSDIYTGILIAAPLFFVSVMSLMSILGGTIGGLSIELTIALGTYIALPFLNIIFITFIEMNQPES